MAINKKELRTKAKALEPVVRIGKSGITENLIKEINKQLKMHKLIKIKLLKSCLEAKGRKEMAKEIVTITDSDLVMLQGNVVVMYTKSVKL